MDESNRRIVILGKTGAGKSSLANTIFAEELFMIDHSLNSGTKKCKAETKSVGAKSVTLIDTPGFFDTDRTEEELKAEIVKCITECAPGPHAFLIVLKVERFTEHEQDVISKICQYFSEDALKYATVLFTHGDQLPEGQTIEAFVSQSKLVSDLVKTCGGRCHVIDNKYWNKNSKEEYRSNQFQVGELLNTIEKTLLANNGSCYTNEMLQAVEAEIKEEEEHIRVSSENMSEKEIRERAKGEVFQRLWIKLAGIATGALLGALLVPDWRGGEVVTVLKERAKSLAVLDRAAEGKEAAGTSSRTLTAESAASAAAGAVIGGVRGYYAAEGADTAWEAAKRAAEAVKNGFVSEKPKNVFD